MLSRKKYPLFNRYERRNVDTMNTIQILAGPIIGATIGYCTNYIAVKMLFRPFNPIKIGNFTLPFTPGIIPKRKPALAHAIGQAIQTSLLSEKDLQDIFATDAVKHAFITGITNCINESLLPNSINSILVNAIGEESYYTKKEELEDIITQRIQEGLLSVDIGTIIATEGSAAIKQKGGMIAMFINDDLIASLAKPIGERVEEYIRTDGKIKIKEYIAKESNHICDQTIRTLLSVEDCTTMLTPFLNKMYDEMIFHSSSRIVEAFDLAGVVENKINAMDMKELEQLILSVMKKELHTIVNLGGLIGFILGLLNLLF